MTAIILLWGIINLFLAIRAIKKIRQNPKGCDFIIEWAFLTGAFVWEDMLPFGLFHATYSFASLMLGDPRIAILCFVVFWVVRSTGEILYQFLQQFIVPKHHPHDLYEQLHILKKIFGPISDQKCFILLQTFLQVVLVISILCLIYILRNW